MYSQRYVLQTPAISHAHSRAGHCVYEPFFSLPVDASNRKLTELLENTLTGTAMGMANSWGLQYITLGGHDSDFW